MKMKKLLAAAGALCLAVTLGACQLFNPTEGRLNDTMHTMFFDFTVTGAYLAEEYDCLLYTSDAADDRPRV